MCLSLDNGVTASLSILYCLADKHQTSEEAGQELGSGAWEQELSFDPVSKVELVPKMAELGKLPPNTPRPAVSSCPLAVL